MHYWKLSLVGLSLGIVLMTSVASAATTFMLRVADVWSIAQTDMSPIHFTAGGNDFGWLIVWRQSEDEKMKVHTSSQNVNQAYDCTRKVRGLYYNSQRGERLWPLDATTSEVLGFADQDLQMEGGLYTSCGTAEEGDPYGIYGHLEHRFNMRDYHLLAGVAYSPISTNAILATGVAPTLQRLDNKFPIGFLYDYNGGIGLVGCELVGNAAGLDAIIFKLNTEGVNQAFKVSEEWKPVPTDSGWEAVIDCTNVGMTLDQLLLLKIQGIIGMSTDASSDTAALAGNERDAKTQYFSSVNVNNATLVNYAKRRAEELCRGKWRQQWNQALNDPEVICWEGGGWSVVVSPSHASVKNKAIIVRHGSITLNQGMAVSDAPLDIFIDRGKLQLNLTAPLLNFNDKGYPGTPSIAEGIYLKGVFIVNGIVVPHDLVAWVRHKVYIHGKFTSLNTYAEPSPQRVTQLQDLLGSNVTGSHIDLTQVFKWRCNYGSGTDGTDCSALSEFQNAPLIIINQNYPSKLTE